jgi:hypothetical protein
MPENNTSVPSTHELVAAAAGGASSGQRMARVAAANERAFAIALAVLIAGLLLAVEYVFPGRNLVVMFGVIALYGVGVLTLVLLYQRRRRASRPGWSKRYGAGFAMTMAFYAVGIALGVGDESYPLAFWLGYAVVTAAPLVIAALISERK